MTRSTGVTVAIAMLLAIASPAAATPLDDARVAIGASDYLKARGALDEALESGAHGRDELAEVHLLRGTVAAALGDAQAATESFQRALALDPKSALPAITSPKITRPFDAAKARATSPLAIRAESGAGAVTLIVVADPMSMIAKARVSVSVDGKPEQTFERPGAARAAIELPPGARLDVRIAVVDEYGNRLAELGSREVPIVIIGSAPAPPPPGGGPPPPPPPPVKASGPSRPIYLKWWLWAGAAVVAGGVATYFGLETLSAKDELDEINRNPLDHSFDEVKEIEDRGRRNALFTNISIGAAGALAVTGAILYVVERRQTTRERRARLDLHPVSGGVAVVLGGHF